MPPARRSTSSRVRRAKSARERQRRARWRRRNGLAPYRLDLPEHDLAAALIASERLTEAEALCPELVHRELHALVRDFILRWQRVTP